MSIVHLTLFIALMTLYYLYIILLTLNSQSITQTRQISENQYKQEKKYILLLNWEEFHKIKQKFVIQNEYTGTHGYGSQPFQSKLRKQLLITQLYPSNMRRKKCDNGFHLRINKALFM